MSLPRRLAPKNPTSPLFIRRASRFLNTQNPDPHELTPAHYDNLINTAGRNRDFASVRDLLNKRARDRCFNTSHTFDFITNTEASLSALDEVAQAVAHIDKGFARKSAYDSLIARLCRLHRVDESLRLVDAMVRSDSGANACTFHPILNALTRMRKMEEARRVMGIMRDSRIPPDVTSYNFLLTAYCFTKNLEAAAGVLAEMEEEGMAADSRTYDALVLGACKSGKVEGAMAILRRMEDDGLPVIYSTHSHVINGLIRMRYYGQAIEFVMMYGGKDRKLDEESFGILASRLINLKRFEDAKLVLKEMRKRGLAMRNHELRDFDQLNDENEGNEEEGFSE